GDAGAARSSTTIAGGQAMNAALPTQDANRSPSARNEESEATSVALGASAFVRIDGELRAEGVPLSAIAAQFGTPCYVYSRAMLESAWREYDAAFRDVPHLVCYAIKANSNLAVLNLFARLGSGFDIVSGGELARVLAAGGDPGKVVFSGVGKSEAEMEAA